MKEFSVGIRIHTSGYYPISCDKKQRGTNSNGEISNIGYYAGVY
jgi:hypothetical protein